MISNIQFVVNAINTLLGNYDNTINIDIHSNLRQGADEKVAALIAEMQSGSVDVLLINNSNPAYTYPDGEGFKNALKKVSNCSFFCRSIG